MIGRRRRRITLFLSVLLAVTATGSTVWWVIRNAPVEVPRIDLTGVDPAVRDAVVKARRRVLEDPDSADAWGEFGMVLLAHEIHVPAAHSFEQASRLDYSGDPRWPHLEGRALLEGNPDPAAAVRSLERAARICGNEPAPRLLLGETLFEQGGIDEAAARFREVLAFDAGNPRAHLGLGRAAHSRGDLETARKHLERSVKAAPRVRATRALLAEVHFRLGNTAAADRERRHMARLPATHLWPDPYFKQVLGHWVGVLADIERANGLFLSSRAEEAVGILRKTLERNPGALLARLLLGRFLLQSGKFAEAEEVLRESVRRMPDAFEAWFELGRAIDRQGKDVEASRAFRKTLEIKTDYAPAHHRLGHCLIRQGSRPEALEAFRDAVRYKPDHAPGQRDLGHLLLQFGRNEEARVHLEQAVRLNPSDRKARTLLESLE